MNNDKMINWQFKIRKKENLIKKLVILSNKIKINKMIFKSSFKYKEQKKEINFQQYCPLKEQYFHQYQLPKITPNNLLKIINYSMPMAIDDKIVDKIFISLQIHNKLCTLRQHQEQSSITRPIHRNFLVEDGIQRKRNQIQISMQIAY